MRTDRRARRSESGFTLIEVVVAFVLLALVLSTGFRIFSEGLARASSLEERSRALEVAQSRLAEATEQSPLKEGVSAGESKDSRFHWTLGVTQMQDGVDPLHPLPSVYSLYRIEAKVEWRGADGKDHALALATAQVGTRP